MNRIKNIVYNCITWLSSIGPRKAVHDNKLLVIRVDEIGDFMLWHKFLGEIVAAFPDHELHFCGNQSWKGLFETFHSRRAARAYWMDKTRFKKDMRYRYSFLKQIYKEHYTTVINSTFSRDKRYDDAIVIASRSHNNYGMVANTEAIRSYEYGYDRKLYPNLFDYPEKPIFELYRNRLFTEFITNTVSAIADTSVNTSLLPGNIIDLPAKFFVVFPGSRSKARIWPTENFVMVSRHLHEHYGWTAVVCGTKADEKYTSAFCDEYPHQFVNLTGRTSLTEMLSVFEKAQCLISVDTGSVHMAASVGCAVFGIFNGSQYKRFAPYPQGIADNFHAIYPDHIEKELQDEQLVEEKYEFVVKVPYADVKPQKVIHAIHEHYRKVFQ